jgi:hypothetical protein
MKLLEFVYDSKIGGAQIVFYEGLSRLDPVTKLDCIQDAIGELNELYREVENECIQEAARRQNDSAVNAVKEIGKE